MGSSASGNPPPPPTRPGWLPTQFDIRDADILAVLAKSSPASSGDIAHLLGRFGDDVCKSLERLVAISLTEKVVATDTYRLSRSTEAFVLIAKHLLSESHYKSFLGSSYFASMLEALLEAIIASRQHCTMKNEELAIVRAVLKTSPSAGRFILFGDTTRFDNLAAQVRNQKMNVELQKMAKEIATQNLLQQAMRFWLDDALDGKTLHQLDGKLLTGQVVRLEIAAAFDDGPAFRASVFAPMVLAKASGNLEAGQVVAGPPELFVVHGTAFYHMGEDELSLQAFDRALSLQITPDVRAAALNNKGLVLLRLKRLQEAISCFEEALRLKPDLDAAKQNLQRATQMQDSKTKIGSVGES